MELLNKRLINLGLDKYIGKEFNGIKLTRSGMFAGTHLIGTKGLSDALKSGEDKTDAFGTKASEYIKKFAGYKTPFDKKIGFFIWHCEEGSNTCSECAEKDGKIFQYGIDEEPPLHPNCNCYVEDIVESDIGNYIDNNGNEWNMASNSISLELKHKIAAEQVSKAFSELR